MMKKMPAIRRLPLPKWLAQTHRQMSNRKPIRQGKSGAAALLCSAPFRLRLLLRAATFFSASSEYVRNRRLRQRRSLPAGAEHHDEPSVRTIAAGRIGSLAYD